MPTYTIRTDAVLCTVDAPTADEAAAIFGRDEFPGLKIASVRDLLREISAIDGAWCWIEGDAPDGERQSVNR